MAHESIYTSSKRLSPRDGTRNFLMGANSSNEGAKIQFSGYYRCQIFPKMHFLPSDGGQACSNGGP